MPGIDGAAVEAMRWPVLDILRRSDLSQVSAKKVRQALAETPDTKIPGQKLVGRLQVRLDDKEHKKQVDDLIRECFDIVNAENNAANAVVEHEQKPAPVAPASTTASNGYAAAPRIALPGLGGVPGSHAAQPSARPSASQGSNVSAPASSGNGVKVKRSRKEEEDVDSDEEVDIDPAKVASNSQKKAKKAAAKTTKPAPKKKRKASATEDGVAKAPNPNNPFNKPVVLSDEMARLCGGKEMPRYMITKQLWVYIKHKELQNPENKRQILCDPTLTSLFGKPVVDSFEMAKLITKHVSKKEDAAPAAKEEAAAVKPAFA